MLHTQNTEARMIRRAKHKARRRAQMTPEQRRMEHVMREAYGDDRQAGPYQPRHRAGRPS